METELAGRAATDETAEWRAKAHFLAGYLAGLYYAEGAEGKDNIPSVLKALGFPAPGPVE